MFLIFIREKVCILCPVTSAMNVTSFWESASKAIFAVAQTFRTMLGSQVSLYLGLSCLQLNAPFKKRFTSSSYVLCEPPSNTIAYLVPLADLVPSATLLSKTSLKIFLILQMDFCLSYCKNSTIFSGNYYIA